MKRIRIGKDIDVTWRITTNAEEIALDLDRLSVIMVRPDGTRVTMTGVTLQGDNNNVLKFHVGHDDQTCLGTYRMELWQDLGTTAQTAVDKLTAWQFVPFSTLEGGYDDTGIETSVEVDLGTSWLSSGGSTFVLFEDAPDSNLYGRRKGTWEEIEPLEDVSTEGKIYGRKKGEWTEINNITDPTGDGTYGRKSDGTWEAIESFPEVSDSKQYVRTKDTTGGKWEEAEYGFNEGGDISGTYTIDSSITHDIILNVTDTLEIKVSAISKEVVFFVPSGVDVTISGTEKIIGFTDTDAPCCIAVLNGHVVIGNFYAQ